MKHWVNLDVSTADALKIDVPEFCHSHTERADVYIQDHGGIWTFGKDEIFNEQWMDYVNKTIPYIEIRHART